MTRVRNVFSVDIEVSQRERELIESLDVGKNLPQFDFYGEDTENLMHQTCKYLANLGNNPWKVAVATTGVIVKAANYMLHRFGKDSVWIAVRASLPHNGFDIPRWHRDGHYFTTEEETHKLVLTINGAPTRFAEIIDENMFKRLEEESMDTGLTDEEDLRIRRGLMDAVREIYPVNKRFQCAVYLVGGEHPAVHSEPPILEPRLFVSVLAGSKEQIAEWQNR